MTVVQYQEPTPLPASRPGDELLEGPTGDVARLRAAAEYANYVAETEFVPDALRGRPAAIATAILYGAEVGLKPMQSLAKISVIKGRPTLSAEAQRGLIQSAGHEIWFEESTITRAIAAGHRAGSDRVGRVTWTMDDAKRAGIAGQANYARYPAEMLRARASAALARAMFADVIGGMPAAEELDGEPDNGVAVTTTAASPSESPTRSATTRRRRPAPAPSKPAAGAGPVTPQPPPDTQPEPAVPQEPTLTGAQSRQIHALLRDVGLEERGAKLAFAIEAIGRTITTSNELTIAEAGQVIEALIERRDNGDPQAAPDAAGPPSAEEAPQGDEQAVLEALQGMTDPAGELDELVTDALHEPSFRIHDLWTQVAAFRHANVNTLIDELDGRNPDGRLLWEPLRAGLRAGEAADLAAYLRRVTERAPDDDIPF